jgi:hypothetical protein
VCRVLQPDYCFDSVVTTDPGTHFGAQTITSAGDGSKNQLNPHLGLGAGVACESHPAATYSLRVEVAEDLQELCYEPDQDDTELLPALSCQQQRHCSTPHRRIQATAGPQRGTGTASA